MAKQEPEKRTPWKEVEEKRYIFFYHFHPLLHKPNCFLFQNGEFPSDAGVIPRAVGQIFDTLEALNAEYDIKVTFLELYNEEIIDLLVVEETSKSPYKPIALMEDGKGGVFIRGLEEEIVSTADEIYKILEKGSAKRRTAETLLNKQSSRSHSIFLLVYST